MPFCIKCGHELPDGASFCPNCGAPVAPAIAAPVEPKAAPKKPSMRARLRHYTDRETGFSFDYPELAGWTIQKPPKVRAPARLAFVNNQLKANLIFGFIQLPNVIPDLSGPGILDAAVANIFGSYQRSHPHARLLSSRLVTNPNNGVKGVELVYTDKVRGDPWKGRLTAFFKGNKRYDVTALALQENFDRADRELFAPVLKSYNF